jgi:hypothetical protein
MCGERLFASQNDKWNDLIREPGLVVIELRARAVVQRLTHWINSLAVNFSSSSTSAMKRSPAGRSSPV